MITERLMSVGAWSIRLRPDTPRELVERLNLHLDILPGASSARPGPSHGTLMITPAPIPGGSCPTPLTVAAIAEASVYSGIYLGWEDGVMSGEHITGWLGQSSGVGERSEVLQGSPGWTASQTLAAITRLGLASSLAVDLATAWPSWIGATLTGFGWTLDWNHKEVLDAVRNRVNSMAPAGTSDLWEWRVAHNFRLIGTRRTAIYGDPGILVTDRYPVGKSQAVLADYVTGKLGEKGWPSLGYVSPVRHVIGATITPHVDTSGLTTRVDVNPTAAPIHATVSIPSAVTNRNGQPLNRQAYVSSNDATYTAAYNRAAYEALQARLPRETLTVEMAGCTLPWLAPVGCDLWLAADRIAQKAQFGSDQVRVPIDGGMVAYRRRLIEAQWPVTEGCGVYFSPNPYLTTDSRLVYDLTPHVEFERSTTKLVIGDAPRTPWHYIDPEVPQMV